MTKAEIDDFRRDLERRILAGEYQPMCEPGQWWDLWRRLEDDVLDQSDSRFNGFLNEYGSIR
jgi:hypothetical protein